MRIGSASKKCGSNDSDINGNPIIALARHAALAAARDIPDDVMAQTSALFQDTIGCILAGSTADGIAEIRESFLLWGGAAQATVLGFGDRMSAPSAAYIHS